MEEVAAQPAVNRRTVLYYGTTTLPLLSRRGQASGPRGEDQG